MPTPEGEPYQSEEQLLEEWFTNQFGVPLGWAVEMAQVKGEVGDHWRGVFEHLSEEVEKPIQSDIKDTNST